MNDTWWDYEPTVEELSEADEELEALMVEDSSRMGVDRGGDFDYIHVMQYEGYRLGDIVDGVYLD